MNILIQFILLYWRCSYTVLFFTNAVKHIRLSSAQQNSECWKGELSCKIPHLQKSLRKPTKPHFWVDMTQELQLPQEKSWSRFYFSFSSSWFLKENCRPSFPVVVAKDEKVKAQLGVGHAGEPRTEAEDDSDVLMAAHAESILLPCPALLLVSEYTFLSLLRLSQLI